MTKVRGFTLVEVLVALTIMAVLAAMAWQGIDAMVRSRNINQDSVERTLRLSSVLGQWEQDLMALSPDASSGGLRNLQYDGKSMRLIRRTDAGAQVLVWAVRDGTLMRWASTPTTNAAQLADHWLRSQQLLGNEPDQLRALEGLASMQVFCYRESDNSWSNCQSTGAISTGVRLVLGFVSESSERAITRDIKLGPQAK